MNEWITFCFTQQWPSKAVEERNKRDKGLQSTEDQENIYILLRWKNN